MLQEVWAPSVNALSELGRLLSQALLSRTVALARSTPLLRHISEPASCLASDDMRAFLD